MRYSRNPVVSAKGPGSERRSGGRKKKQSLRCPSIIGVIDRAHYVGPRRDPSTIHPFKFKPAPVLSIYHY
jgi:hypothetical protein